MNNRNQDKSIGNGFGHSESARRGRSKDGAHHKPGWQTALEHHEQLCVERGRTIDARFNSVDVRFNSVDVRFNSVDMRFNSVEKRLDNIERLQRFTIGAILAWPPLLIAVMRLLP